MSNTHAPIQNIPLNGTLNLDILHSDIKPYQGFNKRNSPIVGGALSPVYHKSESTAGALTVTSDSSVYNLKDVGDGFAFTRDSDLIYKYSASTKFIHTENLNIGAKILAIKAVSSEYIEGFLVYSSDNVLRHYVVNNGKIKLKGTIELSAVVGTVNGAAIYTRDEQNGLENGTSIYLMVWHNYNTLTCFQGFYSDTNDSYTLSSTEVISLTTDIGEDTLSHPFVTVTPNIDTGGGGVQQLIVNLILKSGYGITDPKSYHFAYNLSPSGFVSGTPMTVSFIGGSNVVGVDYYCKPQYLTEDGLAYLESPGFGKTDSPSSTTVTRNAIEATCKWGYKTETGLFNLPSNYKYWYKVSFSLLDSRVKSAKVTITYKKRTSQEASVTTVTKTLTISRESTLYWEDTWTSNYSGISPTSDQSIIIDVDPASVEFYPNSLVTNISVSDTRITDWNPGTNVSNSKICKITYDITGYTKQAFYYVGVLQHASDPDDNILTILVSNNNMVTMKACPPTYQIPNTSTVIEQPLTCNYEIGKHCHRVLIPYMATAQWTSYIGHTEMAPSCLMFDSYGQKMYKNPGYVAESDTKAGIPYGYRYENLGFSVLYNYGTVSGVSYNDESGALGVLVSDWFSFSSDANLEPDISGELCIYVTDSNPTGVVFAWADNKPELRSFDNTVIIPTTRRNIYSIERGLSTGFTDYNNRVVPVPQTSNTSLDALIPIVTLDPAVYANKQGYYFIYASAFNSQYEITKSPYLGILLPESIIFRHNVCKGNFSVSSDVVLQITSTLPEPIDFYFTTGSQDMPSDTTPQTAAPYQTSLVSGVLGSISDYRGLFYPSLSGTGLENILYSLPITSKFILTYVGRDMTIVDGVAYPIEKSTLGKYLFAVYMLSGFPGVKECFVIQGQVYAVTDNYIRQLDFSQGLNTRMDIICSCQGLEFIGFDTKRALFYSPYERSIHVFTGDNVIGRAFQCTQITAVGAWAYNPTTNSILIATNIGVVVFSETMGIYVLLAENNIEQIVPVKDDVYFLRDGYTDKIRLLPSDGYSVYPVQIETEYYGLGNSQVSKVDTVYVKVYNPTSIAAKITVYAKVLTDIGVQTETKVFNIKETDWDKETNSVYLRYQPKFQTSVGFSVGIESDVPIYNLSLGTTPTGVTQVTKNSI